MWGHLFFCAVLWNRTVNVEKFSVLLCVPFPSFQLKRAAFSYGFLLVYIFWCFQVDGLFSSKPGLYEAKREPSEFTSVMFPGI